MTINNMENESVMLNEPEKDETPMSIEEVVKMFADPTEINSAEEIIPFFENNLDKNRICIAIPVITKDGEERKQELRRIGQNLRRAIFKYTGLERDSVIGANLEGLIGEATSDVAKHTVLEDRFKRILALVTKDSLDISFHLVNPARPDVNLNEVNQEDSIDDYSQDFHGRNLAEDFENQLRINGCPLVTDKSHLVLVDKATKGVVVKRDISVELPAN